MGIKSTQGYSLRSGCPERDNGTSMPCLSGLVNYNSPKNARLAKWYRIAPLITITSSLSIGALDQVAVLPGFEKCE